MCPDETEPDLDLEALLKECEQAAKKDGVDHGEQAPLYASQVVAIIKRLQAAERVVAARHSLWQENKVIRAAALEECEAAFVAIARRAREGSTDDFRIAALLEAEYFAALRKLKEAPDARE